MRRMFRAAGLAMLLLAGPLSVLAAEADTQACRPDYQRFCAGEKPADGRIVACLQRHEAELAPACRARLGTLVQCSAQARQLCGSAASAAGASMRACLKAHAAEFSADCRALRPPR